MRLHPSSHSTLAPSTHNSGPEPYAIAKAVCINPTAGLKGETALIELRVSLGAQPGQGRARCNFKAEE
jgi:hypothetical protein